MKNLRTSAAARFVSARFSPEGTFGLHLTVCLLVLVLTGWAFGAIAEDVFTGDTLTLLDARLANWLHAQARPGFTRMMLGFTHLHGTTGIVVLSVFFGCYLAYCRERYWLLALASTVGGGLLLNVALKHVFRRARPSFDEPLLTLATYSFPSGHTAGSTLLYGLLAAFLIARTTTLPIKMIVVLTALTMIGLTGLSRMYLGVHYLSDVMAAMMSSGAWLAVCITAVSTLRRHHLQQRGSLPLHRASITGR